MAYVNHKIQSIYAQKNLINKILIFLGVIMIKTKIKMNLKLFKIKIRSKIAKKPITK